MNTYYYEIFQEDRHYTDRTLISRSAFSGDDILIAKINQAIAQTIVEHKMENKIE
jgi:hypothetical protein